MNPLLKWPGGKRRMIKKYLPLFPKEYDHYFEPFVGGGALYFYLEPKRPWIGDVSKRLMNCYLMIAREPESVYEHLQELTREYTGATEAQRERVYYGIRKIFNAMSYAASPAVAAMMIYLNKTCFNGLWRMNKSGGLNSPFGRYKSPSFPTWDDLKKASVLLGRTPMQCAKFDWVGSHAKSGDLVYFDPPYMKENNSFTAYTPGGFHMGNHIQLAMLFHNLADRGVHVMLSSSDTEVARDLYQEAHIHEFLAPRSINRDGNGRKPVPELLITSYPVEKS